MKLSNFGPGLLLAATGIGVGDMVATTIAGAEHGLVLVWAVAAGVVIKFTIAGGLARWQLVTGTTLVEGWRDHLPRAALAVFAFYFVIWSYFVSSALVAASALVPAALVPAVPVPVWGALHALAAFVMVRAGRFDRFVAVVKVLVGLTVGAVLAAALLIVFSSGADWTTIGTRTALSTPDVLSIVGGVGGTVTLLSYGYWMREAGWVGPGRLRTARADLALSFGLVFVFSTAMMFIATQVDWQGQVLEQGPQICLLLADRIGQEIGWAGRAVFLVGFWGTAFTSVLGVWHGVPFLFDDWFHSWRGQRPAGQRGRAYRLWMGYLTLGSISGLIVGRPIWMVFAYSVVGAFFFPFVIATLLWMNNSRRVRGAAPGGRLANGVLGAALLVYAYLAVRSVIQ